MSSLIRRSNSPLCQTKHIVSGYKPILVSVSKMADAINQGMKGGCLKVIKRIGFNCGKRKNLLHTIVIMGYIGALQVTEIGD